MQSGQPSSGVARAIRATDAVLEVLKRSNGALPRWDRISSSQDQTQRFKASLREVDITLEVVEVQDRFTRYTSPRDHYSRVMISLKDKTGHDLGAWRSDVDQPAEVADLVIAQVKGREASEMTAEKADTLISSLESELDGLGR